MRVPIVKNRLALDGGICVAIVGATIAYLYHWPRDFYWYDEGLVLYESKRILSGDVMYRDFFEIVTPAVWYTFAALFRLFGTSIETARMAMSVLHGITAALTYLCCRSVGVGRLLAVGAAATYVALSVPALPNASPHWFSTWLSMLLLLVYLRRPGERRARWALIPGLVMGLFVAVQHQKAALIAPGAALLFAINHLIDRRCGRPALPILAQWAWFAAGIALITVPMFALLLATAGVRPLLAALVEFPLFHYRAFHENMTWGYYDPAMPYLFVYPELLRWMPLILPLAALQGLPAWRQRNDPDRLKALAAELVLAVVSIVSIYYNPSYVHLAFIAPLFVVLAADTATRALSSALPGGAWADRAALGLGTAVLLAAIGVAWSNLTLRYRIYSTTCRTEFGEIAFRGGNECAVIAALSARLPSAASREMVCYPFCAGLYLMTNTTNPTPYQILQPGYSAAAHLSTALDTLEKRQVPYVVILPTWVHWKDDPFVQYVRDHYQRLKVGGRFIAVFERKPAP